MLQPRSSLPARRRGIILLVVLALLTLFAIVGISFVLYADAEAISERLIRETETQRVPDADPELLFSLFLSQLIFDVNDDPVYPVPVGPTSGTLPGDSGVY